MARNALEQRLVNGLEKELLQVGVPADVHAEPVPFTKLRRIIVIADAFEDMGYTERQSLVWLASERVLDEDELMFVSMILTLTPAEAGFETLEDVDVHESSTAPPRIQTAALP